MAVGAVLAGFAGGLLAALFGLPLLRRIVWLGDLLLLALPAGCALLAGWVVVMVALGAPAPWTAALLGVVVGAAVHGMLPRRRLPAELPAQGVLLASVNLQYDSEAPESTVQSALDQHPEVLVVCEVTARTDALLTPEFPYRLVAEEGLRINDNAVGIYSHLPFDVLEPPPRLGREALRVRVRGPHEFVLFAVHLPRPVIHHDGSRGLVSMAEHRRAVRRLDAALRADAEPVVLAGDLNLSDRMEGYRILTSGRLDAMRTSRPRSTYDGGWRWRWLLFRIDHCIVPAGWGVEGARTFLIRGSDHRGIVARVGPTAPGGAVEGIYAAGPG